MDHLHNVIFGVAVVINVLVTISDNRQGPQEQHCWWAGPVITLLGLAMMLLTIFNVGIWFYLHWFPFQQIGWTLRVCPRLRVIADRNGMQWQGFGEVEGHSGYERVRDAFVHVALGYG